MLRFVKVGFGKQTSVMFAGQPGLKARITSAKQFLHAPVSRLALLMVAARRWPVDRPLTDLFGSRRLRAGESARRLRAQVGWRLRAKWGPFGEFRWKVSEFGAMRAIYRCGLWAAAVGASNSPVLVGGCCLARLHESAGRNLWISQGRE